MFNSNPTLSLTYLFVTCLMLWLTLTNQLSQLLAVLLLLVLVHLFAMCRMKMEVRTQNLHSEVVDHCMQQFQEEDTDSSGWPLCQTKRWMRYIFKSLVMFQSIAQVSLTPDKPEINIGTENENGLQILM